MPYAQGHENPEVIEFRKSTFKSGEMAKKRWRFGNNLPFYSKGRGRSILVSDFIIQNLSCPFFQLTVAE